MERGGLYVFDDIRRQTVQVAADIGQRIGIHSVRASVDGFLYVLVRRQVDLRFSIFEDLFDFFLFKAYHVRALLSRLACFLL
jgi:hypothetical protein